ncbi:MAG: hypothetical protein RLZZ488_16 [Pseudomonadota bacterium]|jgi:hypothetical protein
MRGIFQAGLFFALLSACSATVPAQSKTIYGSDSRLPVQLAPQAIRDLAPAIALLTHTFKIQSADNKNVTLRTHILGDVFQFCSDEPMREKIMTGDCSGFAVNANQLVTARHCIPDQKSCDGRLFIFSQQNDSGTSISVQEMYRCAKIDSFLERENGDLVTVTLDRSLAMPSHFKFPVIAGDTLPSNDEQQFGDAFVLGHPFGTTLTAAPIESTAFDVDNVYFRARADVSQGSSGSPVLSRTTGEILGVLTGGEIDLQWDSASSCNRERVCETHECSGERFTSAPALRKLLSPENQIQD